MESASRFILEVVPPWFSIRCRLWERKNRMSPRNMRLSLTEMEVTDRGWGRIFWVGGDQGFTLGHVKDAMSTGPQMGISRAHLDSQVWFSGTKSDTVICKWELWLPRWCLKSQDWMKSPRESVDREENKVPGHKKAGEWETQGIIGWGAVEYLKRSGALTQSVRKSQVTLVLSVPARHKSTTKYFLGYSEILVCFFLILFKSRLHAQRGAQTHSLEMELGALPTEPARRPLEIILNFAICPFWQWWAQNYKPWRLK